MELQKKKKRNPPICRTITLAVTEEQYQGYRRLSAEGFELQKPMRNVLDLLIDAGKTKLDVDVLFSAPANAIPSSPVRTDGASGAQEIVLSAGKCTEEGT